MAQSKPLADLQKCTLLSFFSLGVPVEPSKLEGPSSCLTFLGIEEDTAAFQLCLPRTNVGDLLTEIQQLSSLPKLFAQADHSCKGYMSSKA